VNNIILFTNIQRMSLSNEKVIKIFKKNDIPIPQKILKKDKQLAELLTIAGIGKKLATQLIQKYPKISKSNIHNFFTQIQYSSMIDLILKPIKQIPNHHVKNIVKELMYNNDCKYFITGSYRRKIQTVSDIDLVMYKCDINKITDTKLWVMISAGTRKVSGIFCSMMYPVKIDIWMVDKKEELPYTILYSTGSYMHNIIMRNKAKRMGLKLTQYGLTCNNKSFFTAKSEHDIYEKLGMKYKKPENR
jgi:DNA polymerase/3'-5' exonuclease PolX